MFKSILLFVCFALAPALLAAEPTPKIKVLMDEPLSLFDWGIFQVSHQLIDIEVDGAKIETSVAYDWNLNKIKVIFFSHNSKANGKEEAMKTCREVIVEIKSHLYIDHITGKPLRLGTLFDDSFVATAFSPAGFQRKTWPEGVAKEVENIMVIKGMVSFGVPDGISRVECESPLLSNKVLFVD
jgi:hypothetical protein